MRWTEGRVELPKLPERIAGDFQLSLDGGLAEIVGQVGLQGAGPT
jgi:hypothetical protein